MKKRIQPHPANPAFWEYDGKPVLLLGGSVEDNLFQIPNLEEHLKLLHRVGGNYIRCTMSSRDPGDEAPFAKVDGLYDLEIPSEEYWGRFSKLLKLSYELDIIVQIEVWDRFDFGGSEGRTWKENAFNPKNNRNYTVEQSGLKETIETHPEENENRFFFTVPEADHNQLVLKYQKLHVDQLLEHALPYPNVLYCMDNETTAIEGWASYWAKYIASKAAGVAVQLTEMWGPRDVLHDMHKRTFDHPELYSFCDISQNNHQVGYKHWDNVRKVKESLHPHVRPVNNVKIYGSNESKYGSQKDSLERFWRNLFAQAASVRFHRPPSGIGLSELATRHIRSGRLFANTFEWVSSESGCELLLSQANTEAYCLANSKQAAVLFCGPGSVELNASRWNGAALSVRWLNMEKGVWDRHETADGSLSVVLNAANEGVQVALIEVNVIN